MRKFADARLPECRTTNARDVHGVAYFLRIELHQLCRCERGREHAVCRMIPTTRANTGGVAKSTLHFVSERNRGDQILPRRADAFSDRERCRNIVARMRRLFGKI